MLLLPMHREREQERERARHRHARTHSRVPVGCEAANQLCQDLAYCSTFRCRDTRSRLPSSSLRAGKISWSTRDLTAAYDTPVPYEPSPITMQETFNPQPQRTEAHDVASVATAQYQTATYPLSNTVCPSIFHSLAEVRPRFLFPLTAGKGAMYRCGERWAEKSKCDHCI